MNEQAEALPFIRNRESEEPRGRWEDRCLFVRDMPGSSLMVSIFSGQRSTQYNFLPASIIGYVSAYRTR